MPDRLSRLLRLDPREVRHGLALGGILFALSCGYTLTKTARDALFLANLPATLLPWVYLAVGAVTTVLAAAWTRLTSGRSAGQSLELCAMINAVGLAVFAVLIPLRAPGLPVPLYFWANAFGLIVLAQFWLYANSLSDPHEAKRTLGMIGALGILGGLIGGVLAAALSMSGSVAPIVAGAAALSAAVPALVRVTRGERAAAEPARGSDVTTAPQASPWALGYTRWLALAALCSVLVATIVEYQFTSSLQRRDTTPEGLARFLGGFYTASNLLALAMQMFITSWALQRLGAGWSSAVLPVGLGAGAVLAVLRGFPAVVATRLWDQVMRISVNRSATQLFFYPLVPEVRTRVKATIDTGLERVGDALAGLLLLSMGATVGTDPRALAVLILALVVVWLVAWVNVRRGYVEQLGANVRRLNLAGVDVRQSLRESSMLEAMERLLQSPEPNIVMHGIGLLAVHAPERVDARVGELLAHREPRVRARAAEWVGDRMLYDRIGGVEPLLQDHDDHVRLNAMRSRLLLTGENPIDALEEFTRSGDRELRRAAVSCIAVLTPAADVGRMRELFERLLRVGGESAHEIVAEAIGLRTTDTALHDLLGPLLRSRSVHVRRAALESAGKLGLRSAVPALLDALAAPSTAEAARIGLAAFGDRVVGTLSDHLVDPTESLEVRRELPRVLARIGTQAAVAGLLRYQERDDVRLDYRVLKALNKIRSRDAAVTFPRDRVSQDLDRDVRSYLFALVHYRSCPLGRAGGAERLLCVALNERMDQALNRIFRRLALIYPAASIYGAYRGVTSQDPRQRGNALEYLENALSAEHAALVLVLVGDAGEDARLHLAKVRYGLTWKSELESFDEILRGDDLWLRTLALYVVAVRKERSLRARIEENLGARDPVLRETAQWALQQVE